VGEATRLLADCSHPRGHAKVLCPACSKLPSCMTRHARLGLIGYMFSSRVAAYRSRAHLIWAMSANSQAPTCKREPARPRVIHTARVSYTRPACHQTHGPLHGPRVPSVLLGLAARQTRDSFQ
jgi:hypothetical protein